MISPVTVEVGKSDLNVRRMFVVTPSALLNLLECSDKRKLPPGSVMACILTLFMAKVASFCAVCRNVPLHGMLALLAFGECILTF